jgi:NADP-reducing hydrogenase subunit HndB
MKSIEDLNRLREKARAAFNLRSGDATARIVISMGTCGIASGARDVLLAVLDEVSGRGLDKVVVTQSGCCGSCEHEPMMEVHMTGKPVVCYGDLNVEKARAIVDQHLGQGVVMEEWVITQASRPKPTA